MKLLEVSLASRLALTPHHSLGAMACAVLAATAFGCAACQAPVKPPPAVTKSTAPAHDPKRDQQAVEYKCLLTGERLVEQAKWQEVATYCAALEARFPKSTYLDRIIFYQGLAHICNTGAAADFALSTKLFERVTRNYPKSEFYEPALYYLALAHFLNNEYQKTVAACSEYLRKYPDGLYAGDLQYRLSYIDSNDTRVEPNKIITEIETFMEGHPNDVSNGSMLCLLADTYKKNHEDDKALAAYQKALWSKSPDDVIQYALDSATTILQARKDWSAIAEMHGEYLRRNPDNPFLLQGFGDKVKKDIREGKGEEGAHALTNNHGTSRFCETTLGKIQALIDLGKFDEGRKLAEQVVGDKKFRGEMAAKAYLMMADGYRVEAAKAPPGDGVTELLKKAYATYQRVEITYQSLPEICAEAYWQAAETAKELNQDGLVAENLKALIDHPRLQDTHRAKDAKDAKDAKILNP